VPSLSRRNPLERYFRTNRGRQIYKWTHYFEVYHRHLARYRHKSITLVEFGVYQGGSLQMWRRYFGRRARIWGVDINPDCKQFIDDPGICVRIGDQEDRDFLRALITEIGPIDVVIDDGGHTMAQQLATFDVVYPAVRPGGVYLVEDVQSSYSEQYGGGLRKRGTFMERAKRLTDQLNAWHAQDDRLRVTRFTRTTRSMHFYDGMVVFEKDRVRRPRTAKTGTPSWS
jgi:cephalosporin hydroxylase